MEYHVGIRKEYINFGTPQCEIYAYVIELRKNKDYLSCEILEYLGIRDITKQELKKDKQKLQTFLKLFNEQYKTNVKRIIVD